MSLQILISAIAPVILILGLGFAAGKHRSFSAEQTGGLSRLALQYARPAALFLGMAHFDRHVLLQQGPVVVVMLIGYSVFFLGAYATLRLFRTNKLEAALLGYTTTSTAAPIRGGSTHWQARRGGRTVAESTAGNSARFEMFGAVGVGSPISCPQ
jgi:hypothetical protein